VPGHFRPESVDFAMVAETLRSLQAWVGKLPRIQVAGAAMLGWSMICITCMVFYTAFPDRSSLPNLLLGLAFGSVLVVIVGRMLISDRCWRREEDIQEHVWAPMPYASAAQQKPRFRRIKLNMKESKWSKSCKTVLEEVDVLCPTLCKQHTCVSCLDDFKPEDQVAVLPCGHIFHETCHVEWHLLKKCGNGCPICRDNWATV